MKKQSYEQQVKEYYPDAFCTENAVSYKFVIINGIAGPILSKKHHKYEENAWKEIANQLKSFELKVTQQAKTFFTGTIAITAKNLEEAKKKFQKMSQKKLEASIRNLAYDFPDADGPIEIWE